MAPLFPVGPYDQIDIGGGRRAPLYIIPFDKHGLCTGPLTRQALLEAARSGGFSDLFLFCHGWNNDWPTATERYRDFFNAFRQVREASGDLPAAYKPLLVGIFWPSTALVFGEGKGPDFAGGPIVSGPDDEAVRTMLEAVEAVAAELAVGDRARFYELVSAEAPSRAEAEELATLMLPLYRDAGEAEEEETDFDAADLVTLWRQLPQDQPTVGQDDEEDDGSFGMAGEVVPGSTGSPAGGPEAAGLLGTLFGLPRQAIRGFTVWHMKDRAGVVGSKGVAPLLRELLAAAPAARSHLIGHSYGCKVLLSAIAGGAAPLAADPKAHDAVTSLLLLQPAINFWCFAPDVDGLGFPGGYAQVAPVVRQPILTTFSKHDMPLRRFFHLAVIRKKKDLGEVKIAGPLQPTRYGGLGGWGPRGLSAVRCHTVTLPKNGEAFPSLGAGAPAFYALDGGDNDTVMGHGDVVTPHTAWALLQQVRHGLGL